MAHQVRSAMFLGSKKFGFQILQTLFDAGDPIRWAVACPPDSHDDRTAFDDFAAFGRDKGLDIVIAHSSEVVTRMIDELRPDIMVVCGYYRILPERVLEKMPFGVWGIHNSLLPKYRGGSPLVWQIINGETELGSTFFRLSSGIDDGDILHQVRFCPPADIDIDVATRMIENLWIKELPPRWLELLRGESVVWTQKHTEATYCTQRSDRDGLIDWRWTACELDRFIRAQCRPYPRAYFRIDDEIVRIDRHERDDTIVFGTPGQPFYKFSGGVSICCGGSSAIKILDVEIGGEKRTADEIITSLNVRLGQ